MTHTPAVPNLPPGFVRLLESGEFVLFLGAGVGIEAGFTDWRTALLELADELAPHNVGFADLMRGEANAGRFLESAELFYLAPITPTERHNLLQKVFAKDPNITRRLKLLTLTRCQGIVTTNFDRSLEMAAAEAHAALVHFGESDPDLAAARVVSKPFFVRLHGRAEVPETLVFAERHYRALPERAEYVEFFRELFLNRNLVFFGFSFADPIISRLITEMTKAVRSVFRREAYALVPEPGDAELIELLRQSSVVAVRYNPGSHHQAAWDLLSDYRIGPSPITAEQHESEQVRSHLAAAYARAKGKEFRADRDRLLSALMMPVLSDFGANVVVDLQEFLTTVEQRLALPRAFERSHLVEAVKLLERDGIVALQGASLLVGDLRTPDELAGDANRLVDGVVARASIKLGEPGLGSERQALDQVVVTALALDGLHLAHTVIRQRPLDADRLERVIQEAVARVRLPIRWVKPATAALIDLFVSPDPEEEQILTNISAVVFGTALLLADPLLADKAADPFERGAYVDASVLLPWIADGHPLRGAYDSILRSFELSRIRVLSGYLNEVMNHKRLALEAIERGGFAEIARFKRYASLFELHNINVFLGGYAGALERGGTETFPEYLSRVAPFESEVQLRRHLEALGLVVEEHTLKDWGIAGELKAVLKEGGKYREDVVIAHDACQIEVLRGITQARARQYFVTADRALVRALPQTSSRHLISNVLLPQQVAFLAQIADRTTTGLQAFSRTLWTVGASTAERVRRYYTDRVLREYEEGLASDLDKILEALLKDLHADGVELDDDAARDPRTEAGRLKVFERLDRFEPRFFQYMAEAKERANKRSSS